MPVKAGLISKKREGVSEDKRRGDRRLGLFGSPCPALKGESLRGEVPGELNAGNPTGKNKGTRWGKSSDHVNS